MVNETWVLCDARVGREHGGRRAGRACKTSVKTCMLFGARFIIYMDFCVMRVQVERSLPSLQAKVEALQAERDAIEIEDEEQVRLPLLFVSGYRTVLFGSF